MSGKIISFVVILSSLVFSSCKPADCIDVSTGWQMKIGDSAEYSKNTYDDSSWETIDLPRILTKDKSRKTIWLRKTFSVPAGYEGKDLALEIGRLWDTDNTYINDVKIGSSGSEFPQFFSMWNYDRYYIIPEKTLRFGETNVVCIRIFSNCISFFDGKPFIGTLHSVRTYNFFQRLLAEYIVIALTVISVFIGIVSLVYFLSYRKYYLPLVYSIGCLLVGLMSIGFYIPDLAVIDYITKDNIFYANMTLVVAYFYFLLEKLLDIKSGVFRITVILAMIAAILVSLTATPDDPVQNRRIAVIASLTFLVYILCGILLLRKFIISTVKYEVVILFAGYLICMFCVFHDIFMMENFIRPGIFIIPIAYNILYLCFGIVLSLRLSDMQVEKVIAERSRDHYENEINLAKKVQDQLIPSVSPVPYISSLYKPVEDVGGDFYDFIRFDDSDKTGIFISDVSGHGLPAAFITSMLKMTILQAGKRKENPGDLLLYINDVLYNQTAGNYITAFYGIYDPHDRTLSYSGAGHPHPYLITGETVSKLQPGRSTALAIFSNDHLASLDKTYSNFSISLPEKSKLLFFTDGLIEARSIYARNACFEDSVMMAAVREYTDCPCDRFVEGLYGSLIRFRGLDSFEDDICMVCLDVM